MIEWVREYCLSFPHATENVQWEDALVFKVAGKIFAIASLEPRTHWLSFKCAPEAFPELIERPGIVPAPYLAKAKWAALQHEDVVTTAELKTLLRQSYDLVCAKLPKKVQATLVQTCKDASIRRNKRNHIRT